MLQTLGEAETSQRLGMITAGLGGLAPASLGETPKKGGPGGATPSPLPQVLPQRAALFQGLFR